MAGTEYFQLTTFRNYFIFFIVFISIASFYYVHIGHINKNSMISHQNLAVLLIIIGLIGILCKRIISLSNTSSSLYFIGIIISIFSIQTILNYAIEYFYQAEKEKGDVKALYQMKNDIIKTIFVLISSVGLASIALYFMPNYVNPQSDVKDIFVSSMQENKWFYGFFFLFMIIYRYLFSFFYSNNVKSSLFVPSMIGIPVLVMIFGFIIYIGRSLKMIGWKNYLTTFVVLGILLSLLFYLWIYIFMDSVSEICKKKPSKEEKARDQSFTGKYLSSLLFFAILVMLWIHDSKKWNRTESILYLIITVILISSSSTLSTNYPASSMLVTWLSIEWLLVTYYNWLNVKNSFHTIFSN
jgi:hypothetical protein